MCYFFLCCSLFFVSGKVLNKLLLECLDLRGLTCSFRCETLKENMPPPQLFDQASNYTSLSLTININMPIGAFVDLELQCWVPANESVLYLIEYGNILMLI